MPINREESLKHAERLLRMGRLDGAIAEYARLVEEAPGDWNAVNALGDLYLRAGDGARAAAQFIRVADHLFAEGFLARAAAVYKKALKLQESDAHTLLRLGDVAARQGLLVDAKAYYRRLVGLCRERGDIQGAADVQKRLATIEVEPASLVEAARTAVQQRPDDPDVLLNLARLELNDPQRDARPALMRVLTLAPARYEEVRALCEALAAGGRIEEAWGGIDVLSDVALLEGDVARAVDALESLLRIAPHAAAIAKLAELRPSGGVPAVEEAVPDAVALELPSVEAQGEQLDAGQDRHPVEDVFDLESLEIDLSDALAGLETVAPAPVVQAGPARDLESVFEDLRSRIAEAGDGSGASERHRRGLELLVEGRQAEAAVDLQAAARDPLFRFDAAAQLGRLYIEQGEVHAGIDWLERAAEAPSPSPEAGCALLYELADALERMGESARALAVLMELDAEAGGYRDVRSRVERLARALAASGGA